MAVTQPKVMQDKNFVLLVGLWTLMGLLVMMDVVYLISSHIHRDHIPHEILLGYGLVWLVLALFFGALANDAIGYAGTNIVTSILLANLLVPVGILAADHLGVMRILVVLTETTFFLTVVWALWPQMHAGLLWVVGLAGLLVFQLLGATGTLVLVGTSYYLSTPLDWMISVALVTLLVRKWAKGWYLEHTAANAARTPTLVFTDFLNPIRENI